MSNYQIEDLEDQAMNKSQTAKRVAAGAALLAGGAGAAFAANEFINSDSTPEAPITADELVDVVTDGVTAEDTAPAEPAAPAVEEVHVYHHNAPQPAPEPEPEVEFGQSTVLVDEDGNQVAHINEGTYDGKSFATYDLDADGHADYFAYDVNGNGHFENNEIINVEGQDIHMHHDNHELIVQVDTPDDPIWVDPYYTEDDDLADINNDFTHEKSGEDYTSDDDLAQHSSDYNNDGDVTQYASVDHSTDEYTLEDYTSEDVADYDVDIHNDLDTPAYDDVAYQDPGMDDATVYDV